MELNTSNFTAMYDTRIYRNKEKQSEVDSIANAGEIW